MTSASHHFASVSCSTVLPVPKPPGIAAWPPRATGNSVSRMRWPVIIGSSAGSRSRTGRVCRTGQRWKKPISRVAPSPVLIVQSLASGVYAPSAAMRSTVPPKSGGSRHCCLMPAPGSSPNGWPAATLSPAFTSGRNPIFSGALYSAVSSGRSSPSKMRPSRPGPSCTESADPVPCTASPGRRPVVSS